MARELPICHRLSKIFRPTNVVPHGAEVKNNDLNSKSYKLMIDQGIISPAKHGLYYLLPLAHRALDKLSRLVDRHMHDIGGQRISCPSLTSAAIWEKTGRLSEAGSELFTLEDRHQKKYVLGPTHEESVSQLLASLPPLSIKQLPLRLYQTTSKFRDEPRPRFGLIRAREFLMKDLYAFDKTPEDAQHTYDLVSQAYHRVFQALSVEFVKVKGCSGIMGGDMSEEIHYPAAIGDDTLRLCGSCGHGWNKETNTDGPCDKCGGQTVTETRGIEVGHLFLLGTRYSSALNVMLTGPDGRQPVVMGSYGLGLTRILAASLEVLSATTDGLRWPAALVPYHTVIIPPKEGSKESAHASCGGLADELYWRLQSVSGLAGDVIVDDRSHMSIGKRLADARLTGYPSVVVVGKAAAADPPLVELHDTATGQTSLHSPADVVSVLAATASQ